MYSKLAFTLVSFSFFGVSQGQTQNLEGITFADHPDQVYLPATAAGQVLDIPFDYDDKKLCFIIDGTHIPSEHRLFDGTRLVLVDDLKTIGAQVNWQQPELLATIGLKGKEALVKVGAKHVVIDLAKQELQAYQGDSLIFTTHVSTGKLGKRTPAGEYKAGPKSRMHRSKLYNNAAMPWSVQVNGNIFIHGFSSVPKKPASHGCIRVPIRAAHWFFRWIDVGTPVSITGEWKDATAATTEKGKKI